MMQSIHLFRWDLVTRPIVNGTLAITLFYVVLGTFVGRRFILGIDLYKGSGLESCCIELFLIHYAERSR